MDRDNLEARLRSSRVPKGRGRIGKKEKIAHRRTEDRSQQTVNKKLFTGK